MLDQTPVPKEIKGLCNAYVEGAEVTVDGVKRVSKFEHGKEMYAIPAPPPLSL